MREKLITLLAQGLKKGSKFYADDLANIRKAVSRKTDAEVREALTRWQAIEETSEAEIRTHSQIPKKPQK